jgi:hypothetical protein
MPFDECCDSGKYLFQVRQRVADVSVPEFFPRADPVAGWVIGKGKIGFAVR